MTTKHGESRPVTTFALYAGTALSALLLTCIIMKLWNADFGIPFRYTNDAPMVAEWIKSLVDNGWYIRNHYIGMPGFKDLGDVPSSDNVHYLIIKFISLFTGDWAIIMNLFFLLTFPLIALSAFFVLRRLRLDPAFAYAGAVLYSFLHYHFERGVGHIFLSAYYMVPIGILISLWVISGELSWPFRKSAKGVPPGSNNKKRLVFSLVACLIISGTGVYYAYFTCIFLSIGATLRSIWDRSLRPAAVASILIITVVFGGLLNLAPQIAQQLKYGKNRDASARVYHEVELYGLKIVALLMPASGHRVPLLSQIKDKYKKESTFVHEFTGETECTSIGFFAGAGFMFLLFFLIVSGNGNGNILPLDGYHLMLFRYLSIFNITAVLISIVGGFNSFIAFIIRYMIRSYSRMSVFIAFFSITAVLILLQFLYNRYRENIQAAFKLTGGRFRTATFKLLMCAILGMVTVIGLIDQTSSLAVPDYDSVKNRFLNDRSFVTSIETTMPGKAMIFQLPYMGYPETRPPEKMDLYDHFRGYLHSNTLRWSFGAVRGRETDAWQKRVSAEPVPEMLEQISAKGFSGLLVNRNGYPDNGEKILTEIRRAVGSNGISNNQDLIFFDIRNIR